MELLGVALSKGKANESRKVRKVVKCFFLGNSEFPHDAWPEIGEDGGLGFGPPANHSEVVRCFFSC